MDAPASLQVDLADPADIRHKLPKAEAILKNKERDLERWRRLVQILRAAAVEDEPEERAGEDRDSIVASQRQPVGRAGQPQELVVSVVNREPREIRSRAVRQILSDEGHDLDMDSVSNALWYAAERAGLIQRTRRGWYAPRAFQASNLDSANGAIGRDEQEHELEPEGRTAPEGDRTGETPAGST